MAKKKDLEAKLEHLKTKAKQLGVDIHFDKLEAAGLRLKDGDCLIKGQRHIFIDKRRPLEEQVLLLNELLGERRTKGVD